MTRSAYCSRVEYGSLGRLGTRTPGIAALDEKRLFLD